MNVPHLFKLLTHGDPVDKFDESNYHYIPEVTPGCEWVLEGEGEACRLYPGKLFGIVDGKPQVPESDKEFWNAWRTLSKEHKKAGEI